VSEPQVRFSRVATTMIVVHTVTYFLVGLLALWLLDYRALFAESDMAKLMRPTTHPLVQAGPLFQPLRGLVLALAIYPLREVVFARPRGWLVLWGLLVALGVVSTFGPSPGSIEGLVYTVIPVRHQLRGLPEVLLQSGLLAAGAVYLVNHPEKRRLQRLAMVAFAVLMLLPLAGLLAR